MTVERKAAMTSGQEAPMIAKRPSRVPGGSAATFACALAATGVAGLLSRVCPAGCATCSTCAVSVLPTAALVGSVGLAAVGSRLRRHGKPSPDASRKHAR